MKLKILAWCSYGFAFILIIVALLLGIMQHPSATYVCCGISLLCSILGFVATKE